MSTVSPELLRMKIIESKEYDKFKILNGNRCIRASHVKRLIESMTEKYIPVPIIVNELHYIIDGQHRMEACKEMGIPFHYIEIKGLGLEDVQRLNSNNKKWSIEDIMESHIDLGNSNYVAYRAFLETHNFGHEPNWVLLKGPDKEGTRQEFRRGKFVLSQREIKQGGIYAQQINEILEYFEEDDIVHAKKRNSIIALMKCFRNDKYSQPKMLTKLKQAKRKLEAKKCTQDYTRQLEEIYFYKVAVSKQFRLDVESSRNVMH